MKKRKEFDIPEETNKIALNRAQYQKGIHVVKLKYLRPMTSCCCFMLDDYSIFWSKKIGFNHMK